MSRLTEAWAVLFGLDKEMPSERAFRHERERILFTLVGPAIWGLTWMVIIQVVMNSTTSKILYSVVVCSVLEILLFIAVNEGVKWHQRKYGGD